MDAESKLKQLYRTIILGHNKNPYHYEEMEAPDFEIEAYNPLCGDKFKLYLQLEEGKVKSASFSGFGCAISKASTSILVKRLEGMRLEDIAPMKETFLNVAFEGAATTDEEFEAFAAAKAFPGRSTCVSLSWESLQKWLDQQ
ncbi:MAG: SUF system NifU family Fe-S cluster assembly protein [Saprospiraceae bacterium]|nr:SUF system NifU family Fe-S cluster assembly protein [Saprospiraceae bacterium]